MQPRGGSATATPPCARSWESSATYNALRHYTATELITAGVDLRAVAGRLGHGGGGATSLRVYADWVTESDRHAGQILDTRLVRPILPGKHTAEPG